MDQEKKYILISAFLSGEAKADQINDLRIWLSESERNRRELEEFKAIWLTTHFDDTIENLDLLYDRAKDSISATSLNTNRTSANKRAHSHYMNYAKWVAAAMIIILFSAVFLFESLHKDDSSLMIVEEILKENPAGIKTRILLPDSTSVLLNSESRLSYNTLFGKKNRDLKLRGEAFFDVEKDAALPFRVSSSGQVVEALGTKFNVRSFSGEERMEVMLVDGKVNIRKNEFMEDVSAGVTLKPGEQFVSDLASDRIQVTALNSNKLLWKEGIIHFERASMQEVFETLERWYGVRFQIRGRISSDWNYTARFDNETLENVLRSISYSKQFEFRIENKKVMVEPKNKGI